MAELSIPDFIRSAAQSRGVDPELALRIAQRESSLNPAAKNPRSSAYGLFQVTDDTWKQYGGDPAKRRDLGENVRVGLNVISGNRDAYIQRFGREPDAGELYAMHFLGRTGGPRLLSANPNAPVESVVSAKVLKANPEIKNKTVGEFIASMQQKMAAPKAAETSVARTEGTVPMPASPRETMQRPQRPRIEPLAEGPLTKEMLASLGPSYQAALAATTLADTGEDDEESLMEQYAAKQEEDARRAEDVPKSSALANLDLSYQSPFQEESVQQFADGGMAEVPPELQPTFGQRMGAAASDLITKGLINAYDVAATDRSKMSAAHKIYLDTFGTKENRGPITKEYFNPEELAAISDLIARKGGDKGAITYNDYIELNKTRPIQKYPGGMFTGRMDPYHSVNKSLGQFNYEYDPKTKQYKILDEYDFNFAVRTPEGQRLPDDFAGDYIADDLTDVYSIARKYGGRKMPPGTGRKVDLSVPGKAPVKRADGSPIYGEVADTGPITADTRRALSLPQGVSAAEMMRLLKGVGREGVSNLESLARGSVSAVPGLVGDIESIFRTDKERRFATTPEVERQYLPSRLTKPTKESAGFIEAGTFIDPTIALKVAKPVAQGTAKAALAGFKSVSPQLENIIEKSGLGLDKSYIVKPEGGNWMPDVRGEGVNAIDAFVINLLDDTGIAYNIKRNKNRANELKDSIDAHTTGLARFEEEFSSSPAILGNASVYRRLIAKDKELLDEVQGELDRSQSIANFIEKKLKPYVKNNLGTQSDQVRLNMDKWELEQQPKLIAEKQKQIDKVRADIDKVVAARGDINPLILTNSQAQLRKLMNEMEGIKARTGSFAQFGGRLNMEQLVREDIQARNLGGLRNRVNERFGQLNWPALPVAGKSTAGKAWESVVDKSMDVYTPKEALEAYDEAGIKNVPAWLTKLEEAEGTGEGGKGIYSLSLFSQVDTHFYHMIDELKSSIDPLSNLPKELRRTPKEIEKMSVEDASTLVDKINGWRASNPSGLDLKRANSPAVFETKTYLTIPNTDIPNEKQLRWVEIKMPDNMPKEEGRRVLNDALRYEGEIMQHCVGTYCPDVEKGTRVFSLRDMEGKPYATIEAVPDEIDPVADRPYLESVLSPDILRSFDNRDISEKELMNMLKDRMAGQEPYMIKQIKGLSNGRPEEEAMPFIDDFITDPSMNWSAINDIQNTNLRQ